MSSSPIVEPLRTRSRFAKATRFTGKQATAAAAGTGKPLPHMADILPADMEREHVIHSADERGRLRDE